jgi:hypothetical protein
MNSEPRVEVFRLVRSGNVEWIETVESVTSAVNLIRTLRLANPARYLIFDRENALFIDPGEIDSARQ